MCTDKSNANVQKAVKPKHLGWRESVLAGRGQQPLHAGGTATGEARSSPSKALFKQVGQELLKGWVRTLWLG